MGHDLLGLLGTVLSVVVINPVDVLVRYPQIALLLLLLVLSVFNLKVDVIVV